MPGKNYEKLQARILFHYVLDNGELGGEICHVYNREAFSALGLPKDVYGNQIFIEPGQVIQLEGYYCKIEEVNFRLEPELWKVSGASGGRALSAADPTDFNCQIGVVVKRLEKV